LVNLCVVVLGVVAVVFVLTRVLPGDPVDILLGEAADAAEREAMVQAMGLDRSLPVQGLHYLGQLARGDLGRSLRSRREVSDLLAERLPATVVLAAAAMLVAAVLSLPLGLLAALRRGGPWDRGATVLSLLGLAIPNFWLGPLLILVFAYGLGWLPVSGHAGVASLVLPALTLGTAMAALQTRMVRNNLLEELGAEYVRAAHARGLSPLRVVGRHALVNALLPVVTIFGLQIGALLTGAVVTEQIFAWPGLGRLTIEAILQRDYPVVQGCVLVISLLYVLVNLVTDLCYALLDPRIRLGAAAP